jgi:hypothetical protein
MAPFSQKLEPPRKPGWFTDEVIAPNASNAFATNSGEAVFWSGKTNGVGGADVAGCIATACGVLH